MTRKRYSASELAATSLAALRELQRDSDQSRKALAGKIGVGEAVLSKVVTNLRTKGLISGFAAILDRRKLGFCVTCFATIRCKGSGGSTRVADLLRSDESVLELHGLMDNSDELLAKVVFRKPEDLAQWQDHVANFGDVATVRSTVVLKTFRESLAVPVR